MIHVFERTHMPFDLGIISAALVLPSILFTKYAHNIDTLRRSEYGFYAGSILRTVAIACLWLFDRSWLCLLIFSAVAGLGQQVVLTSKMSIDTWLLPPLLRVSFSSAKASIASMAIIGGPMLCGILFALHRPSLAFLIFIVLSVTAPVVMLCFMQSIRNIELGDGSRVPETTARIQKASLKHLFCRNKNLAITFISYITVLVILEMEAPLLFPFVEDVYGRNASLAGYLLGICGVGAFLGAFVIKRLGRPLTPVQIGATLLADGIIFICSVAGVPIAITFVLFSFLGAISSVTLVSTETQIQNHVPAHLATPLFSIIFFAGGVLGSALALISTAMAQSIGSQIVLSACGGCEVLVGLTCIIFVSSAARSFARKKARFPNEQLITTTARF
jgi:MFS family permease